MAKIDLEKLEQLTKEADVIFLTPDGEKVLVQLLEIEEQVQKALDEARVKLLAAALKKNKDFNSIQGDLIKVWYRASGIKYIVDENNINQAPKELYEAVSKITYKIDPDAVDKWTNEHGGMPTGIIELEREKKLNFGFKKQGGKNAVK